jgi:uncharacterized repeat protein (TIGR03803 family)
MSPLNLRARSVFAVLAALLSDAPAPAQIVVQYTFTGSPNDGQGPVGALVQSGQSFYAMTSGGGAIGNGTVYRIGTNAAGFTLLHSFANSPTNGSDPLGTLAQSGSTFYGMTQGGGSVVPNDGTVFAINADGTGFNIIHAFMGGAADGSSPLGSPVLSGSTVYGMTMQGGTANLGVVYKANADGTGFQVIHSFTGGPGDGQGPSYSKLVVSGTTIYGMTPSGGTTGLGVIFKMNTDGTGFTVMHSFGASPGDGSGPLASLTLSGTTLFGMTGQGGNAGTIFKINTDATGYTRLHTFTGTGGDGANPTSNDLLVVGNQLYGMTAAGGADTLGTLFGLNTDGTGYNVMHSFAGGPNDGSDPFGDLTLLGSTLWGTTVQGGSFNDGVIFSFPISVPEPSSLLLLSAAAGAFTWAAQRRARRSKHIQP